ncbi:hypothetical protein [Pseudoalteromonas luteoviolacea]|uniref:hypothetical protein n=1 Tax=Pseudoalteromonas luteoviolacea TaxID=43657 RepID=UPI001E5721EA|nr:hypothetical protein [Pseudoalteromonas luteoviolacea]
MDAGVITIEILHSNVPLRHAFENFNYLNEIGPGVYDIHTLIVPTECMSMNPDFGLKIRK